MGAEIDKNFEDNLLGVSLCGGTVLSRPDIFFSKYSDSDVEVKTNMEFIGPNMGMKVDGEYGPGFGGWKADNLNTKGLDGDRHKGKWKGGGPWGRFMPKRDMLNLSGMLNVLDGVVDTPGRILIMTSNHPEKLDAALIRPGRVDKKLLLSYMHGDDAIEMLEHYFQLSLNDEQKDRVHHAIEGDSTGRPKLNLSPAQIEQIAAEHDEIDGMIKALEEKGLVPKERFLKNLNKEASGSS